jgi:hypothetical protein
MNGGVAPIDRTRQRVAANQIGVHQKFSSSRAVRAQQGNTVGEDFGGISELRLIPSRAGVNVCWDFKGSDPPAEESVVCGNLKFTRL